MRDIKSWWTKSLRDHPSHYIIALGDFISGNNNSPSFKRIYKMIEYDEDFLVAKGEETKEKDLISKIVEAFKERLKA